RACELGLTTWVGGLSQPVHDLARGAGVALNLWGVEPDRVAAVTDVEVTWGGPSPKDPSATADLLAGLADAGATWAVLGPPYGPSSDPVPAVEMVAGAAATLR
ncbi:MAG TPA: hypothetical protein VM933_04665, partial [Acidimicrobiales bacterium]|nr:hypothetical protein [Acidimicrobiales bacterium]